MKLEVKGSLLGKQKLNRRRNRKLAQFQSDSGAGERPERNFSEKTETTLNIQQFQFSLDGFQVIEIIRNGKEQNNANLKFSNFSRKR